MTDKRQKIAVEWGERRRLPEGALKLATPDADKNFTLCIGRAGELLRITQDGDVIAPTLEAASEAGRVFVQSVRGALKPPTPAETDHPSADDYRNRAERAEAECKELRGRLAEPTPAMIEAGVNALFRARVENELETMEDCRAIVQAVLADALRAMQEAAG